MASLACAVLLTQVFMTTAAASASVCWQGCGVFCNMCFMSCCSCIVITLQCCSVHVNAERGATWSAGLLQGYDMSHMHLERAVDLYFTRQATKIVGSVWLASQSICNLLHKCTSRLPPQKAARMIAERFIDLSSFPLLGASGPTQGWDAPHMSCTIATTWHKAAMYMQAECLTCVTVEMATFQPMSCCLRRPPS